MKLGAECSEALLTGVVSACRRSLIPACRCGGGRGWVPTSSEESSFSFTISRLLRKAQHVIRYVCIGICY